MKFNYKLRIIILLTFFITISANAQAPIIEWQKKFGGSAGTSSSIAYSTQQTTDGGFIIAGYTSSIDGDVTGNHGGDDFWIVKLTPTGIIEWQKCLGGSQSDRAYSIQQTTDGGYIVAGGSNSINGDVTGNHGGGDSWIVKLTSSGIIEWQKCIGGTFFDYVKSIQQTIDGGYIVAIVTNSIDGDSIGNHGGNDYLIVKLNSIGSIEWRRILGGSYNDGVESIQQTTDGGYIITGYSNSNNGDLTINKGGFDCWVIKLISSGITEWLNSFGGYNDDWIKRIQQTTDGGYIIAGYSFSNNYDITGNHGGSDFLVVKLNSNGAIEWLKSIGWTNNEQAMSVKEIADGYIIGGNAYSENTDIIGHHFGYDYMVLKLTLDGTIVWYKCLGGSNYDYCYDTQLTSNDGYFMVGQSSSFDGDASNNTQHGYWAVKLGPENLANNTFTQETKITLFPNPTHDNLTLKLCYYTPSQEITITDIQGKTIQNQKIDGLTTTINTSSFEKGIYFLTLFSDGNKTTQKFIVE